MPNTVQLKRSSTANSVPSAANLVVGELAINYTDGNLFYKNASNVVTVIASNKFSSVTGNVDAGNIRTAGLISATGNITGGNLSVTGTLSATGATTITAQLTASTGDGTYPIISKDTRAFSAGVTGPQLGFFGLDSTSTNNSLGAIRALAQTSQNGTLEARVLSSGSITTIGTFSSTGLAVTGTLSATGTAATDTTGLTLGGTTTGYNRIAITNTSASLYAGITNSTNGGGPTGTTTNDGYIFTNNATGLALGVNGSTIGRFSSTGLAVTGSLNATKSGGTLSILTQTSATGYGLTIVPGADTVYDAFTINNATNTLNKIRMFGDGSASFSSNITGGNLLTGGLISATGNITANNATFTSNQTLSYGTANGVLYLNSNKVATGSTVLQFDGTNLGLGTTSPSTGKFSDASYAFLIQSASTSTGTNIFSSNSDNSKFVGLWSGHSGATSSIGVKSGTALAFGAWAAINGTGGFTTNMTLDAGANLSVVGDVIAYASSDKKFKTNIRPIPNALSTVEHIGGKLFDWTDEYMESVGNADGYFRQKEDFGIVAQDVLTVFPLAVRKRPDGSLAVDYVKLSALAFASIAELSAKLKDLEGKINDLTSRT